MGQWSLAIQNYEYILETLNPHDAHSYLALAKLQTKRQQYTTAQTIYQNGIVACPTSIHLLQAYAIYEETITHNTTKAQQLYEQALHIDSYNPYVCHAYSCMERKMGNLHHATSLLQQALRYSTTAAVVCTLGELYIAQQQYDQTRLLYEEHIPKIIHKNQNNHRNGKRQDAVRELMEVYLAYAWLEERYYNNHIRAEQLLHTALQLCPTSNVIQIALARFDGRRRPQSQTLTATTTGSTTAMGTGKGVLSTLPNPSYQLSSVPVSTDTKLLATKSITSSSVLLSTTSSISMRSTINNPTFVEQKQQHVPYHHHPSSKRVRNSASIRRLASACMKFEQQKQEQDDIGKSAMTATTSVPSSSSSLSSKSYIDIPSDGRLYNAWANMEVKAKRYQEARKILYRGLLHFPYDHTLLQATGRVEERLGNYSGAQYYYGASLQIQPSAPTLVAYALLNLKNHNFGAPSDVVSKGVMDDNGNKTNGNSSINLMAPKLNMNETKQLFEEALMIDRRHGPAYNAYARTVMEYDNDVHLARTIYERGIRANCTDMASIYHGYARLELSLGNVEVARNILIEGQHEVNRINIGTDSPHRDRAVFLTHTLGMLELNHHRPNHAYDVFLDGIDRYGNSSQLLLGTALSLVKLGKERQARDYFEQAVTTDERHAQAWQAWGMMEMRGGNYKTAKVLLECGIRNTPRYGPLWHAYGLLESRMGNIEMARTLFEKGIEVAPNHVGLYQSWATLELREENYNVAKDLIAEALTRDKHNGVGWMIAADIEQQMGNDGLSLLVLRRGIECSESSNNNHNKVRLYRALGDTLVRLGKIVEARQVLEEGISIDPFYAPLYHSLAELEARVGNVEELARLNKRTASIFNTNALLQATSKSNDTYHRAVMNSQSVFLQNNPSSDVLQNVAALSKRIGPEEEKKVGNISPNRLPNESSIFLDNLMNSYCLDDDGICDLIRGEPNDQEVDER
jgi:crooked neck